MSPPSLFNVCLDFISRNIKSVASFDYIPDVIGKQIFLRTIEHQARLNELNFGAKSLGVFVSAYGGTDMLISLSLSNQGDVIHKHLESFYTLMDCEGLVSLDLTGCLLEDDHHILKVIAKLHRLKNLSLADNLLSETGLRNLTTPLRMMSTGPAELVSLKLSGNRQINDSSVRFLMSFKHLKFLDVSDNFITKKGMKCLCDGLNLAPMEDHRAFVQIRTSGWVSPLIDLWLRNVPQSTTQATQFYGHCLKKCDVKNSSHVQVSRKMRLICRNFIKDDSKTKISEGLTDTMLTSCQSTAVHSEKRLFFEDHELCQNRKKRKLNALETTSVYSHQNKGCATNYKIITDKKTQRNIEKSNRFTGRRVLKNQEPSISENNIDEEDDEDVYRTTMVSKRKRNKARSQNKLLSALNENETESLKSSIKQEHRGNYELNNKESSMLLVTEKTSQRDKIKTNTNQLKPLPIKIFKIIKPK